MARPLARCLVLGNGMAGAEKQAVALAEMIGLPHQIRRAVPTSAALTRLPTSALCMATHIFGSKFSGTMPVDAPYPLVAISCGRASIPASIALRNASGGRTLTVHIQRPECSTQWFDLVIAPRHDYSRSVAAAAADNVLLTAGSLNNVTPSLLESYRREWASALQPFPAPRLVALIGGTVSRRWWQQPRAPSLDGKKASALLRSAVKAVRGAGGSLLVTTSRRTPREANEAIVAELQEAKEAGMPCMLWTPHAAPNPFLGLLAWADQLLVTSDSINMVTEACASRIPVYVVAPEECRGRFAIFHDHLLAQGRTRAWPADSVLESDLMWTLPEAEAQSDTKRAAARVLELLAERGGLHDDKYVS